MSVSSVSVKEAVNVIFLAINRQRPLAEGPPHRRYMETEKHLLVFCNLCFKN